MATLATTTLLASGLASVTVAVVAWRNRPTAGAGALAAFGLAVALWSMAHLLQHLSTGTLELVSEKLMWTGIAPAAFLFFAVVLAYAGRGDVLSGPARLAFFGWPVAVVLMLWLPTDVPLSLWPAFDGEAGAVYWGHVAVSYGLLAVGSGLLVAHVAASPVPFRSQGLALLTGITAAWGGSVVSTFELFGALHFHALSVGFAVLGACLLWGVVRADLVALSPVADRAVVERLSAGVVAVDRNGKVTRVNPAARRLLAAGSDDVIGRDVADAFANAQGLVDLVGTADPAGLPSARSGGQTGRPSAPDDERTGQPSVPNGGPPDRTGASPALAGERETVGVAGDVTLEVELSPLLDGRDRFLGWILLLYDVTESRRKTSRLERQNQRLERLASIVSHDLRNPLNVAIGRLDLAREEGNDDHFDAVADAHDRMARLIDDLLAIARQDDDRLETEPVDLGSFARRSWDTVDTADAVLDVASPPTVAGDRNRVRQLLENLFRNAVEHGGQDVTISVGALADGDGFYVADDGRGIDADDPETVFESGYSTDRDGTGLGLTVVEEVANAHGWDVTVAEGPNGGARFEIRTGAGG